MKIPGRWMQWDTLRYVTYTHQNTPQIARAEAKFDCAGLLQALENCPAGLINAQWFAQYCEFYQLPANAHHQLYLTEQAGERIVVQYFVPAQSCGVALVCHGYYDHVGLYGHLIQALLERNLTVVIFDQPGHGLSSGPRADIGSFDEYVAVTQHVRAHAEQTLDCSSTGWHWVGQSMGGAIVMEYLHQHPTTQVGEVVLLAPLVRPYAWWFNQWVFAVAKLTITERPRLIAPNADNQEFYNLQMKDPLAPRVLPVRWVQAMVDWFKRFERYGTSDLKPKIVQGYADQTVSWRHNHKVLVKRYPQAQWHLIPNGQHHIVNESDEIRHGIWAFLDTHCCWADAE